MLGLRFSVVAGQHAWTEETFYFYSTPELSKLCNRCESMYTKVSYCLSSSKVTNDSSSSQHHIFKKYMYHRRVLESCKNARKHPDSYTEMSIRFYLHLFMSVVIYLFIYLYFFIAEVSDY